MGCIMNKFAVFYKQTQSTGSGYDAYIDSFDVYVSFNTQEELKEWIVKQDKYKKYKVVTYREVSVKTTVEIEIK
jgi:hypothetical protein